MQDLIASFIIQSKECKLPQIGKFNVIVTPSETDIANKQITAPTFKILFSGREEKISGGLIKYFPRRSILKLRKRFQKFKAGVAVSKQSKKKDRKYY